MIMKRMIMTADKPKKNSIKKIQNKMSKECNNTNNNNNLTDKELQACNEKHISLHNGIETQVNDNVDKYDHTTAAVAATTTVPTRNIPTSTKQVNEMQKSKDNERNNFDILPAMVADNRLTTIATATTIPSLTAIVSKFAIKSSRYELNTEPTITATAELASDVTITKTTTTPTAAPATTPTTINVPLTGEGEGGGGGDGDGDGGRDRFLEFQKFFNKNKNLINNTTHSASSVSISNSKQTFTKLPHKHTKQQQQQQYTKCCSHNYNYNISKNNVQRHIVKETHQSKPSNSNSSRLNDNNHCLKSQKSPIKFDMKGLSCRVLRIKSNLQQVECMLRLIITYSLLFAMPILLHPVTASASVLTKHEPMFISRSETFKFVAGDTIILPCEVANTDPYVVAWKRGIAILTAGSVKVTPDPRVRLVNGFNLQIRDAVPQDAGDYICQIATMEPREITHTVEILVPPRIHHISTSGHLQVKKGSSVRIECSASGNPTPNVTWSRKNNILPNGEEKLHSHILSIENVDRHKGGVYICTANNGVGQAASSQVVLHVLYPPEITVERPIVFSGEGHEAMLVCIVHGETQPEVIWFKDTMQLDTTERHIMENRGSRHTLIIRKVHPQDFGNYSCVAENQLGKSRKTLQLSGKPNVAVFNSPPISQYKDRYNISWTIESHTPIEEYKLSFRRLQQGQEVDNSIDSHSSSMLQMYGGGSISSSNGNYRLTSGMSSLGGFAGYGVGSVVHWGRNDWRDVVLPAMPLSHHYTQGMSYMIRGLDPDQHYEATVQARNRYGWSDYGQSFVFSTSSNDGLTDLSAYLNHDHLSDNEMRDLSVTFYGSQASLQCCMQTLNYLSLSLFILLRHSIFM